MEQVKARFLRHTPTVRIEISGPLGALVTWVENFKGIYSTFNPRVATISEHDDGTYTFILERTRNASAPVC